MAYLAGGPLASVSRQVTEGTCQVAGQTSIPVAGGLVPGTCDVYVDGSRLNKPDYDDSDGMQIVLVTAMSVGMCYCVLSYNPNLTVAAPGIAEAPATGGFYARQNSAWAGVGQGPRNKIINGNFDLWQRGTSNVVGAAQNFVADRWYSYVVGTTITQARQSFALGQTEVPGNPKYYNRITVNSVAGAGNQGTYTQIIEGVDTLSGGPAMLTFHMRADVAKNIAVEFAQIFDAGSPDVLGIGVTTCALTTAWKKFRVPVTLPSVAGKTVGASGKNGLYVIFWFDAGSNSNSRTNSLGQQSGVYDIARVQMEPGPVDTPFEDRLLGLETLLSWRYYRPCPAWRGGWMEGNAGVFVCSGDLSPPMRANPQVKPGAVYSTGIHRPGIAFYGITGGDTVYGGSYITLNTSNGAAGIQGNLMAGALMFDAEL